jgi:hypothetical protein
MTLPSKDQSSIYLIGYGAYVVVPVLAVFAILATGMQKPVTMGD